MSFLDRYINMILFIFILLPHKNYILEKKLFFNRWDKKVSKGERKLIAEISKLKWVNITRLYEILNLWYMAWVDERLMCEYLV